MTLRPSCAPLTLTPPPAASTAACDLLATPRCGTWEGVHLGSAAGGTCKVERLSQAASLDGAAIHITSEGCGVSGDSTTLETGPFVFQRVEAGQDLVVTVQVDAASSVQWSEGGLLVKGDESEWLALRSVQGLRLALDLSTRDGLARWEEEEGGEPQPWVRLARQGGLWYAWWRPSNDEAWDEMPGSPLGAGSALDGAVLVGLTHQTSTPNVAAASFTHYGLGVSAPGGEAAVPPPVLAGAVWSHAPSCLGEASLLLDGDAHVELAAPCQLARGAADDASLSLWFKADARAGVPAAFLADEFLFPTVPVCVCCAWWSVRACTSTYQRSNCLVTEGWGINTEGWEINTVG